MSYAREDKARVRPIVDYLKTQRIEVWWDDRLAPGDEWFHVLQEKLNDASCVVVAWTLASVQSRFVAGEVQRAALDHGWNRGRLVPLLLDRRAAAKIPVPFNQFQHLDLTEWDGHTNRPLRELGSVVGGLVRRPPTSEERWGPDLRDDEQVRSAVRASAQMRRLGERIGSVGQVLVDETAPTADVHAALHEIHKTLDVVATSVEEFVSAGLGPGPLDPRPYVRFERGSLARRIRDGRGHCDLIAVHYYKPDGVRAWLQTNASRRVQGQADRAFGRLSDADGDLFRWLAQVGEALTNESRMIVNLLAADQVRAAQRRVLRARKTLAPLEAELGRSAEVLQEVEHGLGFVTKT